METMQLATASLAYMRKQTLGFGMGCRCGDALVRFRGRPWRWRTGGGGGSRRAVRKGGTRAQVAAGGANRQLRPMVGVSQRKELEESGGCGLDSLDEKEAGEEEE
jgi:hypothetical protein